MLKYLRAKLFALKREISISLASLSTIFNWDTSPTNTGMRIKILICGFIFGFIAICFRLFVITNNDSALLSATRIKESHYRKEIVDRNGMLLAVNLPSASLFANPNKVVEPQKSVEKLMKVFPTLDKKKLLADLTSHKNFVWIKRDLTPREQADIFNLGLAGFDFEREQKRIYPYGNLFSHILGYVGRDFTGLAGLEKQYDEFLGEKDLSLRREEQNKPLVISLDARLQTILNDEIDKVIKDFRAKGAVGIVADPNNGEVLALVSKPDFDPHHPNKAKPEELFNMASLGIIETGSVFKALTLAIAFDTDSVKMHDAYDLTFMKVGKFQLKDYHTMYGWHSVPEIFMHSSNIGVAQMILEVGKNNFKKYLKELGLLDPLQIEIPERGRPLFPSDSRWTDLSLVTMSYGYALSITPLHFVQAVIPTVNGGLFYPLTLIKRDSKEILLTKKVFSNETSENMKKLYRMVVKDGNSKRAEVKGYLVGGKTGTAEVLSGGRYIKDARRSSFIGVMPASNPKYVIYIWIDEPKGTKETFGFATAGWTAAPAVGRVLEKLVTLYGHEPVDESDPMVQNVMNIQYRMNGDI